jgi:hypothetical protein
MMLSRPLAGLLLALCLALTSVSLAIARAQPPMAEWVEICGDRAEGPVAVDAEGRPVGPVHLCPDCIAAFAYADLAVPQPGLLPPQSWQLVARDHVLPSQWPVPVRAVEARGPPFLV